MKLSKECRKCEVKEGCKLLLSPKYRFPTSNCKVSIKRIFKEMKEEVIEQMDIEELAKDLHEAGREAVEKKKTVVASLGLKTPSKFLEWNEITEDAKEGRRIQARYLLAKYKIEQI